MTIRARIGRVRRRVRRRWSAEVRAFWSTRPIDHDLVLYESFNGNGVLDSPEALFRALLDDPRHRSKRHVWSLSDENDNASVRREFAHHPRVRFVAPGSAAYDRALVTAGWLISNATFDRQFDKRPGQVYVNTWHGTPLKHMGFDIGDPAFRVANVVRNFLHADVLVTPNDHTTEFLYRRAHRLDGIVRRPVLATGLPRIDREFLDDRGRADVRALLEERGLPVGDRRIVLWAPTWRGTSFVRPRDDAELLLSQLGRIQVALDPDRFVVLLKTHQVVHRFAARNPAAAGVLVPNDIPTNLLLGVVDTLVTDYSSIFFDFLPLERPIVFFAPDIEEYASYRGLSIPTDEWPGPVETAPERVAAWVNTPIDVGDVAEAMRARMNPYDDGHATERLIAAVFQDRPGTTRAPAGPPSVLVVLPAAAHEALVADVVRTINELDLTELDMSVLLSDARSDWYLDAQRRLDPRIRQFVRQGSRNGSTLPSWVRHLLGSEAPSNRREWHRMLADTGFDVVVDASGRSTFWNGLARSAPARAQLTWGGEDMPQQIVRTVNVVRDAS
ncbi:MULTISPECIES: CDP-glycerol glycerophosphotransferase family protein [unclassified Curtobacterium]|uniref:CDP-glycerol glycerophosphotransferase family protein n=1 Tax=unclassified Curtobacterium TaxID=257496 RepID=UPI003A7FB608